MAFLPPEAVSLSKSVQQMSKDGDQPPPSYIVKESSFGQIDSSPSLGHFPTININLFSSSSLLSSTQEVHSELEKLRLSLSSAGCFQVMGFQLSSFLDKVREVAKEFFAIPKEEKQKSSRAVNEAEGHGHDLIVSEKQVLDWSHRLSLGVLPEDQRRLNLWPENPKEFREILQEYAMKMKSMMDLLFKAAAKSLDLEENSFLKQFGDRPIVRARFNFYPPCSRPDLVLGVKAHSDRSGVTILLQDKEVEGLQVFKDDGWVRVPIIPNALVVNLGDQMQIMSNGIFKSPMHRVVTNLEKLRISVAVFNEPEPDKEIGPVDSLVDEKTPRLYRNVKNYGAINYECFQKGKIAIDRVKINYLP